MILLRRVIDYLKALYWIHSGKGFHKYEQDLVNKFYSVSPCDELIERNVIVMIDGRQIHGGLSDRVRGICSVYGFCKENNIPFYINHIYPFNLQDYLQPNLVDWVIDSGSIIYNTNVAKPVCVNDWMFSANLHKYYLRNVSKEHKQIHLYTNAYFDDANFRCNFNELFKPSPTLQSEIEQNIQAINGDFIAMVFRFQQLLGDFKETGYQILAKDEQDELIAICLNKVKELYDTFHRTVKVLVTSDSNIFLIEVNKLDFVYIIPGQVVHMDHTADASFDTYMKSFVDLFLLSKAKKIYLMKSGQMYMSGFAKRAAMVNDILYEEIIF